MEVKKSAKATLENYSKLFLQLGLLLALLIVYVSLEHKVYERSIDSLTANINQEVIEEFIPITERVELVKPPPPPPPAPEVIEIVEDQAEIEETVLESTETDESEAVEIVDISEIEEVIEEEIIEEVPFAVIEEAPIYPGCKGSKAQKKQCLQDKIKELVYKKYNVGLAGELGLSPGKKKVYVLFKINHKGDVVNVQARGPHKRLEKEAVRVVNLLPKMIPAKQRGKKVSVRYTLPITLQVL